ncbi:hypothetical protein Dsin_016583 [Dipteronia sinensis]|uniref:Transposase n=1 Tax=Dipteronia sinensis TaxID=43782 RepID=A0AAE0AEN5_9ROSI|nr:hypothetical protein Dsin_016583 [Dipteronia sinensis]
MPSIFLWKHPSAMKAWATYYKQNGRRVIRFPHDVPTQQQFSAGGNILDVRRSLMSPKSIQMQVCVDDWTNAQNRQQEIDQKEPYDFFKDDQPAESRTDDHGND